MGGVIALAAVVHDGAHDGFALSREDAKRSGSRGGAEAQRGRARGYAAHHQQRRTGVLVTSMPLARRGHRSLRASAQTKSFYLSVLASSRENMMQDSTRNGFTLSREDAKRSGSRGGAEAQRGRDRGHAADHQQRRTGVLVTSMPLARRSDQGLRVLRASARTTPFYLSVLASSRENIMQDSARNGFTLSREDAKRSGSRGGAEAQRGRDRGHAADHQQRRTGVLVTSMPLARRSDQGLRVLRASARTTPFYLSVLASSRENIMQDSARNGFALSREDAKMSGSRGGAEAQRDPARGHAADHQQRRTGVLVTNMPLSRPSDHGLRVLRASARTTPFLLSVLASSRDPIPCLRPTI